MKRHAVANGFGWGCIAGLAVVALMYLANLVFGLRPLSQLLNEPVLGLMPGWLFGFLIDTLQHAGKVVEEFGLIVAMVIALGGLGAVDALASLRWPSPYLPFAFAALAWIVVAGALLPFAGAGWLGLSEGPATPILWAALFAIYAVILQMGSEPAGNFDAGRRRVLTTAPLTIAGLSAGVLMWRLLPAWYQAIRNPPEAGLTGASPAITPVGNFYIVSKNFVDPQVDGASWRLHVGGLADKPLTLSLDELRALPAITEYVTLECISNDVGGDLMSTGAFTGVSLRDLIAMAAPRSGAGWVSFKARDGYTESLSLGYVRATPEILVAYDLDGSPLPSPHGYPARILIPGRYGMKGPKWVDEIDLAGQEAGGFWEQQGWDHNALVKTTSRFDVPRAGDVLKLGAISLAGVAYAGTRGISKVEVSTDGGSSWSEASLDPPLGPLTWILWRTTWTPDSEGSYRLMVRAVDGAGQLQPGQAAGSYPSGASGYHTVRVDVAK